MKTTIQQYPEDSFMSKDEEKAIELLLELALETYYTADDTSDYGDRYENETGDRYVRIDLEHHENISRILDKMDELPDDQPGYILGPVAKCRWALRNLGISQV